MVHWHDCIIKRQNKIYSNIVFYLMLVLVLVRSYTVRTVTVQNVDLTPYCEVGRAGNEFII